MARTHWRWTRPYRSTIGLVVLAGCAGETCSGMGEIPGGFPEDQRIARAVQMRVSDQGISAVEDSVVAVIDHLFPGGIQMAIPKSCGDPKVCCDLPDGACQVALDFAPRSGDAKRLDLSPRENDIGLEVRARGRTTRNVPFKKEILFYTLSCDGSYDSTRTGADSVRVTANLTFPRDDAGGTAGIAVNGVTVHDFDSGDFAINGGVDCEFAEAILKDQIIDGIRNTVQDSIASAVRGYAEVGFQGRVDLTGALVHTISAGTTSAIDLYQFADTIRPVAGGVSIDMWSGADPGGDFRTTCAPEADPPTPPAGGIPSASFLEANQAEGAGFDVAMGVHKFYLDQAGWAAYESGLLCATFGTRDVDLLNAGSLQLLAPSMADLIFRGGNSEVVMALRPKRPPTFTLGDGTITGEGEIDEALITMNMPELGIDVYTKVDDRFVRLMTLETDVVLPFGLDIDPSGRVTPVLGDLATAFTNLRARNSKLLAERPEELAEKFPTLLSLAVPFVGDQLGTLVLPSLAGLGINPVDPGITAIDDDSFVAIFGNLVSAGSAKPARVDTRATVTAVRVPPTEAFRAARLDPAEQPAVELALGGVGHDGTDRNLEWQMRVDGGYWSPWSRERRRTLHRQAFWVQGRHRIEVRARMRGEPLSADQEPAVMTATIDTLPPVPVLEDHGDRLRVTGRDAVSSTLRGRARVGGAAWKDLGTLPAELDLDGVDRGRLEVAVIDEAGNEGVAGGSEIRTVSSQRAGCSVAAGPRARGGAWLVLLLAAGWVLFRRRAWLLLALAAPGCTCSGMITTGGEPEVEVRESVMGRWNDVAVEDGRVVVSAYEQKYGDLVLVEIGEEGGQTVRVIDGLPEGAPADPEGPAHRDGVVDPGEDVGGYTQIALRGSLVQVAYHDFSNRALKFAAESPEGWVRMAVDPGDGIGHVGLFASMTHDAAGVPGIAYMAFGVDDGAKGRKSELRWAKALNAAPGSAAEWTIETLAEAPIQCTGLCGDGEACVAATDTCETIGVGCADCGGDDKACVEGACVEVRALPELPDGPRGTGLYATAGLLSDGRPVVAFYDRQKTDLMIAVREASGWVLAPLHAAQLDVGQFASLVVAGDTVHVAYLDASADQLRYLSWQDGTAGASEVVDDGVREGERHPVGASPAIFITPEDRISVAYQDQATTTILVATREGDAWTHEDLLADTTGSGFFNSVAVTDVGVTLATHVYDRRFYPPGGLTIHTP